jgi:hypothetical protein
MEIIYKACYRCSETKPLFDFYKNRGMKDGHLNQCIPCTKKVESKRRADNVEYWREQDRKRALLPHRIKSSVINNKIWRNLDKRRVKCHNAVARAVKKGILVKLPCERCQDTKSVAHHEDYDKPLDVMWLCQICHTQRHKEIEEQKD